MDCSLVVNEVIDEIRKKGIGGLIFKVDFEKAYDSVDWSFLDVVMIKMGFGGVGGIGYLLACPQHPYLF